MAKKLFSFLSLAALSGLALLSSCSKKSNTINNDQVIITPYTMYFSDTTGAIYNTNDGKIAKLVVASDGYPIRSIVTDGKSILVVKPNMYVSMNNGVNFNYSYKAMYLSSILHKDVLGKTIDLNQSMLVNVPSWAHSYASSVDPANGLGIIWNADFGAFGKWINEDYYDTIQVVWPHAYVTTFTVLKNGTLIAMDPTWEGGAPPIRRQRCFYRPELQARWKEATLKDTINVLPRNADLGNSNGSWFSLGHLNNEVIAIDNIGNNGAWYSDDICQTWFPFSGLPANTPLMSICSPFEEVCLIGTDGKGVYLLNPNTNTFQPSNNGLPANLSVRGITYKENIYKNDNSQRFVYISTNKGIYRSSDMGVNWQLTIQGNFINIY